MASIKKNYSIKYYPEKTITDPTTSEVFYKVKSVTEKIGGSSNGIELTANEYKEWKDSLTPFHYINDQKYRVRDALINVDEKSSHEELANYIQKENNVISNWERFKELDLVGNIEGANYFKQSARTMAYKLDISGQKRFILLQMAYVHNLIKSLEDLMEDATDLQNEYLGLIEEYENLKTT